MESKTQSEIESIDIANDDLIEVLASLADGDDERLAVVGDGPRRIVMRTTTTNVVEDTVIYTSKLVENGAVADTIEIDGDEADVQVL